MFVGVDCEGVSALASDGRHLYVCSNVGLLKVGSGYGGTMKVRNREQEVWLICVFVCLSVCYSVVCLFVCLFVCLSSVCLSVVCLLVCPFV